MALPGKGTHKAKAQSSVLNDQHNTPSDALLNCVLLSVFMGATFPKRVLYEVRTGATRVSGVVGAHATAGPGAGGPAGTARRLHAAQSPGLALLLLLLVRLRRR